MMRENDSNDIVNKDIEDINRQLEEEVRNVLKESSAKDAEPHKVRTNVTLAASVSDMVKASHQEDGLHGADLTATEMADDEGPEAAEAIGSEASGSEASGSEASGLEASGLETSGLEASDTAASDLKPAEPEKGKAKLAFTGKPVERRSGSVGAAVERKEADRLRAEQASEGKGGHAAAIGDKDEDADRDEFKAKADPLLDRRRRRMIGVILLLILAAGVVYYFYRASTYKEAYVPGTYINGINAEGKTPQEIKEIIKNQTSDYSLCVISRDRENETLTAQQVGLEYVTGDVPEVILGYQNRFNWIKGYFTQTDYKVSTMTALDEDKFMEAASKLACFDDETAVQPRDAYVSGYIKAQGYEVVPEVEGNVLTGKEQALEMIRDAMLTLDDSVDLSADADLYAKPAKRSTDSGLNATVTKLNKYMTIKIRYLYSDVEIDGDLIDEWLTVEDDGSLVFDDEQIEEFVEVEVAGAYDTLYLPKELDTSWGPTVTVTGGSYGWQVDQKKEIEQIKTDITAAQSVDREPIYSRTAASHGEHDYGDTYVEINLTAQHLYYYKNGKLVIDTDFVSGLASNSKRVTPVGVYSLTYKQTDRILRGQKKADGTYEYESHVNFWMPFNGGIGMHDASWRSSFGGNIYKTNGSHGCINMPYKAAKTVYNEIEKGCPVICYQLPGSSGAGTYVDPDAPVPTETTGGSSGSQGTKPAATQPASTKPAATSPASTVAPAPQSGAVTPATIAPTTQPATIAPTTQPAATQPAATKPASTGTPVEGVGGGPGVTGSQTTQQESTQIKEGVNGGPGA